MGQRQTLGPPDAPVLVLSDNGRRGPWGYGHVDDFGVQWLCDSPTGWEDDDWNTPLDEVDGVDGGLLGPQSLAPRQVGISGTLVAADRAAVKAAVRRLRAALPRRGATVYAVRDEDEHLWVPATPAGAFKAVPAGGGLAARFTFSLVSEQPYRFGTREQRASTGLPDASQQTGVELPMTLGSLSFGASAPVGGSVLAMQSGDVEAWPLTIADGPVLWPTSRNATTGQYATWAIRLATGSRMVADHRTGLVTVNGVQAPVPLVGYGAQLWPLAPGRNEVEFRSVDDYDPRAQLTLSWYDTYR